MRFTKVNLSLDRVNILLHWLLLIGGVLVLGVEQSLLPQVVVLFIIAGAWAVLLTIFSLLNQRLPYHEIANLAVDGILALLFALLVPYGPAGFLWAGLLPILTGALYFRFQGGAVAAAAVILLAGIILTLQLGNAGVVGCTFPARSGDGLDRSLGWDCVSAGWVCASQSA